MPPGNWIGKKAIMVHLPSRHAHDRDCDNNKKHEERDSGDFRGAGGDAAKAENRGDDRNDEECCGLSQHDDLLPRNRGLNGLARSKSPPRLLLEPIRLVAVPPAAKLPILRIMPVAKREICLPPHQGHRLRFDHPTPKRLLVCAEAQTVAVA